MSTRVPARSFVRTSHWIAAAVVTVAVAGCGGAVHPVPYAPDPGSVARPSEEIRSLILANTTPGCISEPEFSGSMLVVKFVCSRVIGNQTVRFDRIAGISLQESEGWYRVLVKHDGAADFVWTSRSLDDMRRLADALTALASRGHRPKTKATATDV